MKENLKNNYFICATEQSGDNIGEKIIQEIQLKYNIKFDGVGGEKMSKLMNFQYYSVKDFKSIGLFEIIGSINKYLNIINFLSKEIIQKKYKIVITIDSPDFNFRLAKKIKNNGFRGKIIQIVAPTVWAWRKNRAKKFSYYFDKLLVIFPFEKKYFEKYKLSTTFIGHPIFWLNNFKKNRNIKYIAFLPGSREGEIIALIKYFNIIVEYLNNIPSNYEIFIPTLPHLKNKLLYLTKNWKKKPLLETDNNIIEKRFSKTYIAVVCSGTASLEITKRKIPQLVMYKLNFFTVLLLNFFAYIKYANIINIIADKMIIPEIVNFKLDEKSILHGFKKLLHAKKGTQNKQIIQSKKILDQLILKKSPEKLASQEIEKLLFPKPFKN